MTDFETRAREAAAKHTEVRSYPGFGMEREMLRTFEAGAQWSRRETLREVIELLESKKIVRGDWMGWLREHFAAEMGEGK